MLHYLGLSCMVIAQGLEGLSRAVCLWFRKLEEAFPKPKRRRKRVVAMDETKLKLCGEQPIVWAAVGVRTGEVLACRASWARKL